ncbi:TIGR02611 family protein [Paramicrobacterium fandaimingii]|uniref:TIGR02611 family protein n=1 Tax=Paramicrobacterium fandaimingii TaxID=2708079 RepID=UPI00141DF267|nr:TIGR02611 family protein [Microbacterium fandaimingii]
MTFETAISRDIVSAESPDRPIRRMLRRIRVWLEQHPRLRHAYRVAVGTLGTVIALLGLVLVPLPGPGWLIVFLGLAILGTEFRWARRLSGWLKRMLSRFWAWQKSRRAARA